MSAPYPFIDIAVLDAVRVPFARGRAVLVLDAAMKTVLWANGMGARMLGRSVGEAIGAPLDRPTGRRQIAAVASRLAEQGRAKVVARLGRGFRAPLVPLTVHAVRAPDGERLIVLVEGDDDAPTEADPAALLDTFEQETAAAVLGADDEVLASTRAFDALALDSEAIARLRDELAGEADRLVKRPVPGRRGEHAAGIGRLTDAPVLDLMLVVSEAGVGPIDPTPEQEDEGRDETAGQASKVTVAEPLPESRPSFSDTPVPDDVDMDEAVPLLRFVWASDGEGRLVSFSDEFLNAVGMSADALPARAEDLDALVEADRDRLARVIGKAEPFDQRTLAWGVSNAGLRVPVVLAGVPQFEDGTFAGHRGHGLLRLADAVLDDAAEDTGIEAKEGAEPATPESVDEPPTRDEIGPASATSSDERSSKRTLTDDERRAFREIGDVLGADLPPRDAEPAAQATVQDEAAEGSDGNDEASSDVRSETGRATTLRSRASGRTSLAAARRSLRGNTRIAPPRARFDLRGQDETDGGSPDREEPVSAALTTDQTAPSSANVNGDQSVPPADDERTVAETPRVEMVPSETPAAPKLKAPGDLPATDDDAAASKTVRADPPYGRSIRRSAPSRLDLRPGTRVTTGRSSSARADDPSPNKPVEVAQARTGDVEQRSEDRTAASVGPVGTATKGSGEVVTNDRGSGRKRTLLVRPVGKAKTGSSARPFGERRPAANADDGAKPPSEGQGGAYARRLAAISGGRRSPERPADTTASDEGRDRVESGASAQQRDEPVTRRKPIRQPKPERSTDLSAPRLDEAPKARAALERMRDAASGRVERGASPETDDGERETDVLAEDAPWVDRDRVVRTVRLRDRDSEGPEAISPKDEPEEGVSDEPTPPVPPEDAPAQTEAGVSSDGRESNEDLAPDEEAEAKLAGPAGDASALLTAPARRREPPPVDTSLLGRLPIPVLVQNASGLLFANEPFHKLTGYASLDELTEAGGMSALLDGTVSAGSADDAPAPMRLRRKDGTVRPVTAQMQTVPWGSRGTRDAPEGTHALLLTLRPTDERGRNLPGVPTEAIPGAIEDRLSSLNAALDEATDGVVFLDAERNIRSLSRRASEVMGYEGAEIAGRSFAILFAPESQRAALELIGSMGGNGPRRRSGVELTAVTAGDDEVPLFVTIGALRDDGGFCAVLRDISGWRQTEESLRAAREEAEAATRQKSRFLTRISHEIRTPLNAIIGFAEVMAEERLGPVSNPRYREYLTDIRSSGRHVLDLVNDLLDIAKIEAGRDDLRFESVDLDDVLREATQLIEPLADDGRVVVRQSLGDVPPVVADRRSIKQIALNILTNAVRYTEEGGQVIVSTKSDVSGVTVRVRDTGVGMGQEDIDRALEPFAQVTSGSVTMARRPRTGTGLGLPLSKAMAEANRAQFSISSVRGRGTLVELHFPADRVLD